MPRFSVTPRQSRMFRGLARFGNVVPWGLVGAVGLIVVVEMAMRVWAGGSGPSSRLALSWSAACRAAGDPAARAEIVCFGDSLAKLAIIPRVIEHELGLSAYNLSVLAGQAPCSYVLLSRLLESGHRPRAILVDFACPLLTVPPSRNPDCWAEIADRAVCLDLAMRGGEPWLATEIAARTIFPTWRARGGLRARLGLEPPGEAGPEGAVLLRNWFVNQGAQVAPRGFLAVQGALPEPYTGSGWTWRPDPTNARYVDAFLDLAGSRGIPVFWLVPPSRAERVERLGPAGVAAANDRFIAERLARFPSLTVLDGQGLRWDSWAYRDPTHLNRDGAIAFSLAVARAIGPRIEGQGGRRKVDLAETLVPRAPGLEVLVEDLDQSRAVLADRGSLD